MRRVVQVVLIALAVMAAALALLALLSPGALRALLHWLHDWRWWSFAVIGAVAVALLVPAVGAFLGPSSSPWRVYVLAMADTREHKLDILTAGSATRGTRTERERLVCEAVGRHLATAREAACPTDRSSQALGRQFIDWWTGAKVEAAFVNLHEAEIAMSELLPNTEIEVRVPEALARLQTMDASDPRRRSAEAELARPDRDTRWRASFKQAVRIGLELKDQQHARIRAFRNIVLTSTLGLMSVVAILCVLGAVQPDALPLCYGPAPSTAGQPGTTGPGFACPSEDSPPSPGTTPRRLPARGDVTLVALLGLLGGGFSATVAIRQLQGSSIPYDVPVSLSLLKLPSGALSALVGLLLIKGEFVPGLSQLDNQPQILAYAFLFGVAQWIVTRLVDRQAQDILSKVPSKEPATTKPAPAPADALTAPEPPPPPKPGLVARLTRRRKPPAPPKR